MEGKLKKIGNEYKLYAQDDSCIATSWHSPYQRLSKKNCQAIVNGYDLDEIRKLADEDFECELGDGLTNNESINSMLKKSNANGAEWGFQKALEILGDKKFSEEDMIEFAKWTFLEVGSNTGKDRTNEQLLLEWKSIQQTEFDVEIVMVKTPDGIFRENDVPYASPKLDAENCLILKRK